MAIQSASKGSRRSLRIRWGACVGEVNLVINDQEMSPSEFGISVPAKELADELEKELGWTIIQEPLPPIGKVESPQWSQHLQMTFDNGLAISQPHAIDNGLAQALRYVAAHRHFAKAAAEEERRLREKAEKIKSRLVEAAHRAGLSYHPTFTVAEVERIAHELAKMPDA